MTRTVLTSRARSFRESLPPPPTCPLSTLSILYRSRPFSQPFFLAVLESSSTTSTIYDDSPD